jgi:large subunit ribosomal protein L30
MSKLGTEGATDRLASAQRAAGERSRSAVKKTLRVKQVKSGIGFTQRQRQTLRGLGLKRMLQVVELEDTPAVRGMITSIAHLVKVEE